MSSADSETTAPAPTDEAPAAPSGGSNISMSSPGMRIGAVIAIIAIAGVVLWLVLGTSHKKKNATPPPITSRISATIMTPARLKHQSRISGTPIYWAGRHRGYNTEYTRATNGRQYVRYLPSNLAAGADGKNFLIVSTYPFPGAYDALKKTANGKQVAGPNGSIYFVNPAYKNSVYMAWPSVAYQVEVYDPVPTNALDIASSGDVRPAGR